MYVWMILTLFLAMLASYTLPVRDDYYQIRSQPVAEAELNKLVVRHEAALKYARKNIKRIGSKKHTTYSNGTIGQSNVNAYYPEGFRWDNGYETQIFCLNESGGSGACGLLNSKQDYVVTFGELPERWVNQVNGRPNGEYERVLAKAMSQINECGLIDSSDSTCSSGYRIRAYNPDPAQIGACIPNGIKDSLQDYDLNRTIIYMTKVVDRTS